MNTQDPRTYQDLLFCRVAYEILRSKDLDRTIFTAVNGDSATAASHMISALMKGCLVDDREGFRICCLHDPNAVVTRLSNDFSYKDVFAVQLRILARRGAADRNRSNGNSSNILRAWDTTWKMGMNVIRFSGRNGTR